MYVYTHSKILLPYLHIQQWRTPKNPISQGRLSSATAKNSFHIGILHSDGNFRELLDLLEKGQQFAILCPIGVISQLSRKENDAQNQWKHDEKLDTLIHNLSKVVLSQDNQVWLINLSNSTRFVDVLTSDYVGVCEDQIVEIMLSSLNSLMSDPAVKFSPAPRINNTLFFFIISFL